MAGISTHGKVLLHSQAAEYTAALRHLGQTKADDFVGFHLADQVTVIGDLAAGQLEQAGDGMHGGGFASTVCTDQSNDLAFVHMERNILDGVDGTVINIDIFNRKQLTH